MNKGAIQRFAIWARNELIAQVSQRAYQYGITKEGCGEANAVTVGGRALTGDEQKQRKELVDQIRSKGYTQVMEEVAYTWFNRFIALRFMEVNNYLPSHIRVFSDSTGAFKPEILSDVLHLELPGLNREKVAEYIESNDTEGLYRYLLLTQCNALNEPLPRMFEKMGGYTELLLPNNILKQDSVLGHMVADIPEADWTDQVQIIGWLYQYYNSELKDDTFALLKKNVKITKERIPSATQLFTPDWIVRYMVENSLGRIFIDKRKNEGVFADGRGADEMTWEETEAKRIANEKYIAEQMGWKYYLPEAEQTQEVRNQLDEIQNEYATLDVKDIKVIDPCMGSGHILVYAFDVLMQIYEATGYSQRDAAQSILENNLYGLDIDDRAAQLAYFAVMMKARQYDRRIFSRGIQPHVYAIVESNGLDSNSVEYFTNNDPKLQKDFGTLMDELRDAKEYGSILNISQVDFASLYARVEKVRADISMFREIVLNSILPLIQVAEVMAQKYDVVVTNPPYMGSSGMGVKLSEFVKKNYSETKADLFSCFIERGFQLTNVRGFVSMITMESWMFLSSFEKMRQGLVKNHTIMNMVHMPYLGKGGTSLGINFGTAAFVFNKCYCTDYNSQFDYICYYETDDSGVPFEFPTVNDRYKSTKASNFTKIPGSPVAYWLSDNFANAFRGKNVKSVANPCIGMRTGDNDRFLRLWFEVCQSKIGFNHRDANSAVNAGSKWIPYHKGGNFRKWYGNNEYVVNWENDGEEIKENTRRVYPQLGDNLGWKISNEQFYFKEGISWTSLSSGDTAFRRYKEGFIFSNSGQAVVGASSDMLDFLTALLNSRFSKEVLDIITPTMGFESGYIAKIPVIIPNQDNMALVIKTSKHQTHLSSNDWDSYETSWDFTRNPLVNGNRLTIAYAAWKQECEKRFHQLKKNEEELNRIFIDIYGLQDELTPDVADKEVTVHRVFDRKGDVPETMKGSNYVRTMRDEIVSLISYAVGCMFGRYSLDKPGLVFAGYSKIERSTKTLDGDAPELEKFAKQNADGSVSYGSYYHEVNQDNYKSFPIDTDNIIPICDDDYFDDDITGRFVKWVETVYGKETLEENLKFIADALGGKGTPREVIRSYFLNDFYADHLKTYQKRPIYWLFDSGKKNGFKALIYMHRYQSDLLARMRTDYVHEQQERYRTQLTHLADAIEHAGAAERVKLTKQQKKLQEQALEIQKYEEKVHHLADQNIQIDLDDGVKHNYELFADVLAKIK